MTDDTNLLARLADLENRVLRLEGGQDQAGVPFKQQSLREFLNEKNPQTANDRGLCIAYYLETSKAFGSFNAEDIKRGFREARIPVPSNPNDVVNKNIMKGYVMDAEAPKDGKKAWILTVTGMVQIQKGFAADK